MYILTSCLNGGELKSFRDPSMYDIEKEKKRKKKKKKRLNLWKLGIHTKIYLSYLPRIIPSFPPIVQ